MRSENGMGTNTQICNIQFLFVSETLHRLLGLALLLRQDHFHTLQQWRTLEPE
jgi:hypothetical protein